MDYAKVAGDRKIRVLEESGLCYKTASFAVEAGLCMSVLGCEGIKGK